MMMQSDKVTIEFVDTGDLVEVSVMEYLFENYKVSFKLDKEQLKELLNSL